MIHLLVMNHVVYTLLLSIYKDLGIRTRACSR